MKPGAQNKKEIKMNSLEIQFTVELLNAAEIAKKECKYNPSFFIHMLDENGGVETAKKLLRAKKISDGFEKLWELKRLDLTVEAIVLNQKWNSLFTKEELGIARTRLKQFGYDPIENVQMDTISENNEAEKRAWSTEELSAAVDAYLLMLEKELNRLAYNKAEINRGLREGVLKNRNKSSIEFRMQNISSVMEALCLPRIKGYLPAKNLDANVFQEMKQMLESKNIIEKNNYEPTEDEDELDKRVSTLSKSIRSGKPIGVKNPEKIQQLGLQVFKRDPLVKTWTLNNANGKCEKCEIYGPFEKEDGTIYLEVHHLTTLSDGGSDTVENTIALCPNCHRELHYSKNRFTIISSIKNKIERLQDK